MKRTKLFKRFSFLIIALVFSFLVGKKIVKNIRKEKDTTNESNQSNSVGQSNLGALGENLEDETFIYDKNEVPFTPPMLNDKENDEIKQLLVENGAIGGENESSPNLLLGGNNPLVPPHANPVGAPVPSPVSNETPQTNNSPVRTEDSVNLFTKVRRWFNRGATETPQMNTSPLKSEETLSPKDLLYKTQVVKHDNPEFSSNINILAPISLGLIILSIVRLTGLIPI